MSESGTIKIVSLIMSAILATLGMINNDLILLIPAMIISPIGFILNDISNSLVTLKVIELVNNLLLLLLVIIVTMVIGYRLSKMFNGTMFRKSDQFNETKWKHIFVSVIVGIFSTWFFSIPTFLTQTFSIIVGMVATVLPPLISIGFHYNDYPKTKKIIINDFKIVTTNLIGFTLGASLVQYYLHY
jgi:hypothetical protein